MFSPLINKDGNCRSIFKTVVFFFSRLIPTSFFSGRWASESFRRAAIKFDPLRGSGAYAFCVPWVAPHGYPIHPRRGWELIRFADRVRVRFVFRGLHRTATDFIPFGDGCASYACAWRKPCLRFCEAAMLPGIISLEVFQFSNFKPLIPIL